MIYKIAAAVLVVALCVVPVFAADSGDSIEYLCEEHNCIKPDGVPDAVCSVCFFGESDGAYSVEVASSDVYDSSSVVRAASPVNGNVTDRSVLRYSVTGTFIDVNRWSSGIESDGTDFTSKLPDLDVFNSTYPEVGNMFGFSYSPVRESYFVQLPYSVSAMRMTLVPWGVGGGSVILGTYPDGLTYNLVFRATADDGTYSDVTSVYFQLVEWAYQSPPYQSTNVSRSISRSFWSGSGSRLDNYTVANKLAGYQNLWFARSTFKIPAPRFDDDYEVGQYADADVGVDVTFVDGCIASPPSTDYGTLCVIGLTKPAYLFEVKRLTAFPYEYNVASGEFPANAPGGGSIPGVVYPSGDGGWEDKQFEQGVNPELSGTANSVDGNIDTLQGIEAQVHADLDRYLNESGISNYTIPSSLGSAFTWVSDKFTSFINVNGELKTILLFPAYLGILVAMVHGLEFAGRTLSHKARKGGGDG